MINSLYTHMKRHYTIFLGQVEEKHQHEEKNKELISIEQFESMNYNNIILGL